RTSETEHRYNTVPSNELGLVWDERAADRLLDVKHVEQPVVGFQDERRPRGPVERQAELLNQRVHHGQVRRRKREEAMRARKIRIVPFRNDTSARAEFEALRARLRLPLHPCPQSGFRLLWKCRPGRGPK